MRMVVPGLRRELVEAHTGIRQLSMKIYLSLDRMMRKSNGMVLFKMEPGTVPYGDLKTRAILLSY